MEDATPIAESMGVSKAPEEVMKKKTGRNAALLSNEELTSNDKKRLRRATKAKAKKQRTSDLAETEIAAKVDPNGRIARKVEDRKTLEVVQNDKRVVTGTESAHAGDSSKSSAFFSRMQESVRAEIQDSMNSKKSSKKASKATISSRKYKL
jgi:U3 small nucleolar ribonucleoprotein component